MTSPVTFAQHQDGHLEVMLGPLVVGRIFPYPEHCRGTEAMGGVGAHYSLYLFAPDSKSKMSGARSLQSARRSILFRLAESHEQVSPLYRPMVEALLAQAEAEGLS